MARTTILSQRTIAERVTPFSRGSNTAIRRCEKVHVGRKLYLFIRCRRIRGLIRVRAFVRQAVTFTQEDRARSCVGIQPGLGRPTSVIAGKPSPLRSCLFACPSRKLHPSVKAMLTRTMRGSHTWRCQEVRARYREASTRSRVSTWKGLPVSHTLDDIHAPPCREEDD